MAKVNRKKLAQIGRELLVAIGENPDREGLVDTPNRWAKWWGEFIDYDPGKTETAFESVQANQMVVVSGMKVWSLCEHHLLPFWAEVSIGYIPDKKVLGLSKFGRLAHKFAHSLQIQERLAQEIADSVRDISGSKDVAVLIRGEHLCMTMRGVRTPAVMTTSIVHGAFRDEPGARDEFLKIVLQGAK